MFPFLELLWVFSPDYCLFSIKFRTSYKVLSNQLNDLFNFSPLIMDIIGCEWLLERHSRTVIDCHTKVLGQWLDVTENCSTIMGSLENIPGKFDSFFLPYLPMLKPKELSYIKVVFKFCCICYPSTFMLKVSLVINYCCNECRKCTSQRKVISCPECLIWVEQVYDKEQFVLVIYVTEVLTFPGCPQVLTYHILIPSQAWRSEILCWICTLSSPCVIVVCDCIAHI